MKLVTNFVAIVATLCGSLAIAAAAAGSANPLEQTPTIQYKSPFRDYRPLGENKLTPWKAANEEVGKIGGWRVYAREMSEPASTLPTSPSAPVKPPSDNMTKPMPSGHAGHGEPK